MSCCNISDDSLLIDIADLTHVEKYLLNNDILLVAAAVTSAVFLRIALISFPAASNS